MSIATAIRASGLALLVTGCAHAQLTFTESEIGPSSGIPASLAVADMDGDGDADIIAASRGTVTTVRPIWWIENEGGNAPSFPTWHLIDDTFRFPAEVFAADFDNDGDNDLVLSEQTEGTFWYENDGGSPPVFTRRQIDALQSVTLPSSGTTAVDVDGDGDMDILTAHDNSNNALDGVRIYTNDFIPGGSVAFTLTHFEPRNGALTIMAGDLTGDGAVDFITGENGAFSWWRNDGFGDFSPQSRSVFPGRRYLGLGIGDLNNDGFPDLACTLETGGLYWFPHSGDNADPQFNQVTVAQESIKLPDAGSRLVRDGMVGFPSDALTVEMWVRSSGSPRQTMFSYAAGSTGNEFVIWKLNELGAWIDDREVVSSIDVEAGTTGEWNHVAVTWRSGTGRVQLFVNGALEDTTTESVGSLLQDGGCLVIGDDQDAVCGGFDAAQSFIGNFRDIRLWDYARTEAEIAADYDRELTGAEPGLVSYWPMNDRGPNVKDHAGSNDMVLVGNATWEQIATNLDRARKLSLGDLDGDGDLDIVTTSPEGHLRWHENRNAGRSWRTRSIRAREPFFIPLPYAEAIAVDINGDTDMDIVEWYELAGKVRVSSNNMWTEPVRSTLTDKEYPTLSAALSDAAPFDRILAERSVIEGETIIDLAGLVGDGGMASPGVELHSRTGIDQPSSSTWILGDFNTISVIDPAPKILFGDTAVEIGAPSDLTLRGTIDVASGFPNLQGSNIRLTPTSLMTLPPFGGIDMFIGPGEGGRLRLQGTVDIGQAACLKLLSNAPTSFTRSLLTSTDAEVFCLGPIELDLVEEVARRFATGEIDTNADGVRSVFAADVDGDGDMDVLSASEIDDSIRWYENDGREIFTPRVISDDADIASAVWATDLDDNGDMDVLSASPGDGFIRWYQNNGSEQFSPRTIFEDVASGVFTLAVTDLDEDGDKDVISGSQGDGFVRWHENNGSEAFTHHTISVTFGVPYDVLATNLDGDEDLDIVAADLINGVVIFRNDGGESFTEEFLGSSGGLSVAVTDVDSDGDKDIVATNSAGLVWFEAEAGGFADEQIIDPTVNGFSIAIADIDGDGVDDIVGGYAAGQNAVRWYGYEGGAFTQSTVFFGGASLRSVFTSDVNSDGLVDVLSTSKDERTVRWHRNIDPVLTNLSEGTRFVSVTDTVTNAGVLALPDFALVYAAAGFTNTGDLAAQMADIVADTLNDDGGVFAIEDAAFIQGNFMNDGVVRLAGELMVMGDITNNGTIEDGPPDPLAGSVSGTLVCSGDLIIEPSSTLTLGALGLVSVGGDFSNAINDNARFNMVDATLQLDGGGMQSLEVMSVDIGADSTGLDRTIPGHYPLDTLRIGPSSTIVNLADAYDNANDGQTACEALYARHVIIDAGAMLNTGGCRVYYETLELNGTVDTMANLVPIRCPGDTNGDNSVDFQDLNLLLDRWNTSVTPGASGDLNNDGAVNFGDLNILLDEWGNTC